MHHPGVQAIGHGEGLEVASQGHGQRELVHQVHGRAGHHRSAAQVLQAQNLGEKRTLCLVSAVPDIVDHRADPVLSAHLSQDSGSGGP